jgi:hypothetical protein
MRRFAGRCLSRSSFVPFVFLLLLVTVFMVGYASPAVAADGWATVPLTANFTENEQPQIDGDYVVWRAYDGVDWEIMLFDLATAITHQLTHDGIDQSGPQVDGDHIVWVEEGNTTEGNAAALVLHDVAGGSLTRIPESEGVRGQADIEGDLLVWATASAIYLYDLASGATTQVTTGEAGCSPPCTDGRYVVFKTGPVSAGEGSGIAGDPQALLGEIFVYDHENETLERVATSARYPQVAQGLVVWQEGSDKSAEIVFYDTATKATTSLTDDSLEDTAPVVGGGKVAWLAWGRDDNFQAPHDSPWKVMLYDTATAETTVVTENSLSVAIQEDGDVLVWSYWGMGPFYVAYDIQSGESAELMTDGLASFSVALDGGRVVWMAYPGFRMEDDRNLYLASSGPLPPAATPPTPPVREFSDIADSPYAGAIQELAARGIARGYRANLPIWSADAYRLEYRPEEPVLRWQFLKMLLAVAGIDPRNHTQQPPFLDIQGLESGADHNLRYYIQTGLDTGIVKGVTATRFAPFGPLSRAQAVTMAVRAAQAVGSSTTADTNATASIRPFGPPYRSDLPGSLGDFSPVHGENMRIAEQSGLLDGLVGFGPGWDPWTPMTRGEAAELLVALAEKLAAGE